MKVQATPSHTACRHSERVMLLIAWGWLRADTREGRQKHRNMRAFTCHPAAFVLRTVLTCPSLVSAALQAHFGHFLLPPLSTPRSLLNAPLCWFCWYSWISPSAVQGQGVGVVLPGSVPGCEVAAWHTQSPGRASGIHSWNMAEQSHLHISPSDRTVFPSAGAVLQAGPCSSSRDYKAHQILLQFSSPWSPSYTQTITQTSEWLWPLKLLYKYWYYIFKIIFYPWC